MLLQFTNNLWPRHFHNCPHHPSPILISGIDTNRIVMGQWAHLGLIVELWEACWSNWAWSTVTHLPNPDLIHYHHLWPYSWIILGLSWGCLTANYWENDDLVKGLVTTWISYSWQAWWCNCWPLTGPPDAQLAMMMLGLSKRVRFLPPYF